MRERNLHKFTTGKAKVVVATDVAARGIHVDNVDVVVHFDAPNDPKAYLHRSGRTARAGESGMVVTITTPRQLDEIVRMQARAGVETRHHDIRTTPRPMNALVLAESGQKAPAPRKGGSSAGGPGRRGPGGRASGGRGGSSSYGGRSRGGSSYGDRPARRDDRPARRDDRPARTWDERPSRPAPGRGDGRSFEQRTADRAARAQRRDGYRKPSERR